MPRKVSGPNSISPMTTMATHTSDNKNPLILNCTSQTEMALRTSYKAPNHTKEYAT